MENILKHESGYYAKVLLNTENKTPSFLKELHADLKENPPLHGRVVEDLLGETVKKLEEINNKYR